MGTSDPSSTGERPQATPLRQRARNFVSLQWYEDTIKFLYHPATAGNLSHCISGLGAGLAPSTRIVGSKVML